MVFATSAYAQQAGPAATTDAKDHSETAELLSTAGKLVKYGYQTKTAMPLIQAIEIYNRLGVSNETETRAKTSTSDAIVQEDGQKATAVSFDVAQLATDATTYAAGDKNLLALLKDAQGTRGRVGGAIRHYDSVCAGCTDTYNISFYGGQQAIVVVSGDGDTDLDLYVYDNNGNFIDSDTDYTDDCVCTFTPRWTGNFIVKVVNRGRVYNNYVIATN